MAVAAVTIGIYEFGWYNYLTRQLVKIMPLPAAIVDRQIITLDEVFDYLELYRHAVASNIRGEFENKTDFLVDELVDDVIVADLAAKRNLEVTDKEQDQYWQFLLHKFGLGPEEAGAEIRRQFGASESEFKKMIVFPDLQEKKLRRSLLAGGKRMREAGSIREKIEQGLDFAEAAGKHSDDEKSKYLGGSIGFVGRRDLEPWLEDAVFSLEAGKTSQVTSGSNGYYIFRVTARDFAAQAERLEVRQIFFKDDSFDYFLRAERGRHRIYVFSGLQKMLK